MSRLVNGLAKHFRGQQLSEQSGIFIALGRKPGSWTVCRTYSNAAVVVRDGAQQLERPLSDDECLELHDKLGTQ